MQSLQVTNTTLNRKIDELLTDNIIRSKGNEVSSGGRPPLLYEINPNYSYIVGIDLSRTHTTVALIDLSFQIVEKKEFRMTDHDTPQNVISNIKNIIKSFMDKSKRIIGVGIGTVGPLDREKGVILNPESFVAPGWKNIHIIDQLQQEFSIPFFLENGANTALLGESFRSNLIDENILYCLSGEGLRCGFLTNNQLIHSTIGDVSTFEHMIIDYNGTVCSCGKKGCLTQYMSFSSIYKEINLRDSQITVSSIEELFELINLGNPQAEAAIMKSAYFLGIGLSNIITMLHPNYVILGGLLINQFPHYYNHAIETAKQNISSRKKKSVQFRLGELKKDAVTIGSAIYVFQSLFTNKLDHLAKTFKK